MQTNIIPLKADIEWENGRVKDIRYLFSTWNICAQNETTVSEKDDCSKIKVEKLLKSKIDSYYINELGVKAIPIKSVNLNNNRNLLIQMIGSYSDIYRIDQKGYFLTLKHSKGLEFLFLLNDSEEWSRNGWEEITINRFEKKAINNNREVIWIEVMDRFHDREDIITRNFNRVDKKRYDSLPPMHNLNELLKYSKLIPIEVICNDEEYNNGTCHFTYKILTNTFIFGYAVLVKPNNTFKIIGYKIPVLEESKIEYTAGSSVKKSDPSITVNNSKIDVTFLPSGKMKITQKLGTPTTQQKKWIGIHDIN